MADLKEQATSREVVLNNHAELMAQEYNGAVGRLRAQAVSQEAELAQRMKEHSATLKAKEKEILDLQATLTNAKESMEPQRRRKESPKGGGTDRRKQRASESTHDIQRTGR